MKQTHPSAQDRPVRVQAYRQALTDLRQSAGDEPLRCLKVLAQVCHIDSQEHRQASAATNPPQGASLDTALAKWLEERQRQWQQRCDHCGMTLLAGVEGCPRCKAAISADKSPAQCGDAQKTVVKWAGLQDQLRNCGWFLLFVGLTLVSAACALVVQWKT